MIRVFPKIMRQMCYKMAKKYISLIHFNIIFSDNMSKPSQQNKFPACSIFLSCLIIFGMTHKGDIFFRL